MGELRGRAARLEPIADLAALKPIVDGPVARGLVIELTPPGRGQIVSHNLYTRQEIAELKSHPKGQLPVSIAPESGTVAPQVGAAPQAARAGQPPWPPQPTPEFAANDVTAGRVVALTSEVAELRTEVDRLRQKVTKLEARLTALGG